MVSFTSFRGFGRWSAAMAAVSVASVLSASALAGVGADYGSNVVSFTQGSGLPADYFNSPTAALGAPAPVSGVGSAFPNVVNPFSPAFDDSEIVVLGQGGQITLKLGTAFTVANTAQLGVISNVGLIDNSYPAGVASSPATIFGGGVADVRVSSDGKTFVDLGNITFNTPASAFSQLGNPYETAPTASDVAANFGKPFTGSLSKFDGATLAQSLTKLNGSVGGTWLNVSGSGLKTVDYVQIRNPLGNPWTPTNPVRLAIDALTVSSDAAAGSGGTSAVPLPAAAPAGLALLVLVGIWSKFRKTARV